MNSSSSVLMAARSSRRDRATLGMSVIRLSTPRSMNLAICRGLSTVQTWTSFPAAWAAPIKPGVARRDEMLRKSTFRAVTSPMD